MGLPAMLGDIPNRSTGLQETIKVDQRFLNTRNTRLASAEHGCSLAMKLLCVSNRGVGAWLSSSSIAPCVRTQVFARARYWKGLPHDCVSIDSPHKASYWTRMASHPEWHLTLPGHGMSSTSWLTFGNRAAERAESGLVAKTIPFQSYTKGAKLLSMVEQLSKKVRLNQYWPHVQVFLTLRKDNNPLVGISC